MSCVAVELPEVKADLCAPDVNFSEIDKIFLGNANNPLADWSNLTEWNTRLDNSTTGDLTKIRYLHVIGSKPKPEKTKIEFSQNRTLYTTPKHSIPFKVDETGPENYALLKFLEDNAGMVIPVWYQVGKYLYGGPNGVQAKINMDDVIDESSDVLQIFEGLVEWEDKHPLRITNPMA